MKTEEQIKDLIAELKTDLSNYPYEEHEEQKIGEKIELLYWVLN